MMILADSVFNYTPAVTDWVRILPDVCILVTALLVLLFDLFIASHLKGWMAIVGLAGVVASFVSVSYLFAAGDGLPAFNGMMLSDSGALLADGIILIATAGGLLLSPGYVERQGITQHGEYYTLMLLASLGMMIMASAGSLLTIFVGLESLSLALYILSAYIVLRPRSREAGLKYFILSSFASAFLLYGMALTYGATGSTTLHTIAVFIQNHFPIAFTSGNGLLLVAGMALMAVGFSFKVSAIPFHAWTPDVYVGAPTSVTAFMSVGTKVAAFAALARVFIVTFQLAHATWSPLFWAIAVLTMVAGNIMAVTQRDVKRMLAYSSIATAGYILVAVVTGTEQALAGMFVYLAGYAVMNLGAFGALLSVEHNDGRGTTLDDLTGLARRRRGLAALLALFLFALAGVPPTVGFLSKYTVFYAAVVGGHTELAVIGVLASAFGMYYYLRVVWAMYFVDPLVVPQASYGLVQSDQLPDTGITTGTERGGSVAVAESVVVQLAPAETRTVQYPEPRVVTPGTWLALAATAALTLVVGIFPAELYAVALQAAHAMLHP